jgi:peptide deformylase
MIEILHHPNPLLKSVAKEVTDFADLQTQIDKMIEIMYVKNGIGLAAPQLGDLRRIIVIDPSNGQSVASLRVMINPVIIFASSDKEVASEGCLSLPGTKVNVSRSKLIDVKYVDLDGRSINTVLSGLSARITQHEIDHINGVTLLDHIIKRKSR